ncbi:hypothetical protein HPP92_012625 [Vanilla planifolia]|uniref:Uncharacterized protein n=1 Tax=Vanilla planifolia TaxID=51239 RepID=A0A835QQU2_VANPL|nr:hypothetical protein HPP92_012625 [Vanilla planifolia]
MMRNASKENPRRQPSPALLLLEREEEEEDAPLPPQRMWASCGKRRILTKQFSMRETKREVKWEKRKRQMYMRSRSEKIDGVVTDGKVERQDRGQVRSLTDEDLDELRGSIDLGFGFSEVEGGHDLCRTLPALNLYFAVNRQLSDSKLRMSPSPASTPTAASSSTTLYGTPSPRSPKEQLLPEQSHSNNSAADGWKIFNPGDSPQHVKTKLRHWAQVVACSVRQCS